MIDPSNITNYNQNDYQLEETLLFWILAAGKNGTRAAKCLEELISYVWVPNHSPFDLLRPFKREGISHMLKECKSGCRNLKARTIIELIEKNLDLMSCTPDELESVFGIGRKTSRCFIIHSRKNARYAGLDTHILKFLNAEGVPNVPKSTPSTKKDYLRLEQEFLSLADKNKMAPADLDLQVWNKYAVK